MSKNLVDLFLRESNAIEKEYSEEAFSDSVDAWDYAVGNYDDFGIDYVCGIHEKLMGNVYSDIAGKLRRKKVYIVGERPDGDRFVVREIEARGNKSRLRKWCDKYETPKDAKEIRKAHIDFEMIHPFLDGNGRTGRILYNVQKVQVGLPVEVFYEKNKQKYYKWFAEEQAKLDYIEWLLKTL